MIIRSVVISMKLLGIGLLIVWKSIKFVLLACIVNLLLIHHVFSSLNLLMISTVRVFKSEWCINRVVSSVNNLISFWPIALYISLMYIAKKQWSKNRTLRKSICYIFSCDQAALRTAFFRPSVRPSVTPFWQCSCHRTIMTFSGVIANDRSDVHAKGKWIYIWCWNYAKSLMLLRRGALLFFNVIRQISRSHG